MNTRFHVSKNVLGQCLSMWEIVHVKEQMCILLIITWSGNINCTKLVLKPFTAKNSLFQSCLLLFFCRLYYFSLFDEFSPFLYTTQSMSITAVPFFEKLKWEAMYWIQYTDHKPQTFSGKLQFGPCLHTAKYHYLFEGCTAPSVRLRQIY